jgi:hypothetical protein
MGIFQFLQNNQKHRVKQKNRSIIFFLFFIAAHNLFGMDIKITGKEIGLGFSPEYNRTFNFCWDLSAVGLVKLNDKYAVKAGLALGSAGTAFEIKGFAGGEMALPVSIPLYIGLSYNYNGLPEYEYHTHSLPLLFSYKGERFGAALGFNPRFSAFLGELPVFELIPFVSLYVFIYKTDILQFKLEVSNFNDFIYGNFNAYFLKFNNIINLSKGLSLINEIELHQSGGLSLATNFYGIVYHGGVIFLW